MKKTILGFTFVMLLCNCALAADFSDVTSDAWYYDDVMNAVQLGLINGKSESTYCPDDYLTYAEAAKLAACMNQIYSNGEVSLKNGDEVWYETYTDYCLENGIIDGEYLFTDNATRAGYMEIFAKALPEDALMPINNVPFGSIPDVDLNAKFADEVYTLYRAGILQGSDAQHSCKPNDNIKRSEVAAIITRMMDTDKRIRFDMELPEGGEPLTITYQPQDLTVKHGDQIVVGVGVSGGKEPYSYRWQISSEKDLNGDRVWRYLDEADSSFIESVNEKIFTMAVPDTIMASVEFLLRCEITDALGNAINSELAHINCESPLRVLEQPKDAESVTGETASVSVEVIGGSAPYSYRWMLLLEENQTWAYINSLNEDYRPGFDGLTDATLTYMSSEAATKRVRCEITDAKGTKILSNEVSMTINIAPDKAENGDVRLEESSDGDFRFILNRSDQNPLSGNDIYYECKVIGGKLPLKYQWEMRSGREYIAIDNNRDNVKGARTATLSYTLYPTRSINGRTVRLTITDADGKTASCEPFTTPLGTFVMDVQDKINLSTASGVEGTIISGRILDGTVVPGQNIFVYSEELGLCMTGTVSRIEMFGKSLDEATKDDNCGLLLSKASINTIKAEDVSDMLPQHSTERTIIMNTVTTGLAVNVSFGTEKVMNAKGNPGKSITLSVTQVRGGTAPYTYRWMSREKGSDGEYKELSDGEHYMSVTKADLEVNVSESDYETEFICKVTDASGKEVFTQPTYIYPERLILAEKPPVQTYANYGDKVTLKVKAFASAYVSDGGKTIAEGTLKYRWKYYTRGLYGDDYVDIGKTDTWASGYDTPELTLFMETFLFNHSTVYRCVITDQNGNEVNTGMVYIVPEKPYIFEQPDEETIILDEEDAILKIDVRGHYTPYTFKWEFAMIDSQGNMTSFEAVDGKKWAKITSTSGISELIINNPREAGGTRLRIRCIITDSEGNSVTSRTFRFGFSKSPNISLVG